MCLFLALPCFNGEYSKETISISDASLSSSAESVGNLYPKHVKFVNNNTHTLPGKLGMSTTFNQLNDERNWFQLSIDDQRKLLDYDIDFQGTKIPLKYVFAADDESLEFLQINDILSHNITLGVDGKFNVICGCYKENRFLENRTKNFERFDVYDEVGIDHVVDNARINKGVYLSDVPQEDIPNLVKVVAQKIKKRMPSYWIVIFDFQSFDNIAKTYANGDSILEYVSKNVLNLTHFEEHAFRDFFASNRVVFLCTLSTEANTKATHNPINLLNAIRRQSNNHLWIFNTVRKLDLASEFNVKIYRQLPIEDRYWIYSKNHWSDRIERRKAKDYNEWKLELSAWANITTAKSTNCDDDADKTLYGLFKHYTNIIISSTQYPSLTATDVESIYQKRSLLMLFPEYSDLVESWFPNSPTTVDFDTINFDRSYIYRDQIHAVTAEFFVVDFFNQQLFSSDRNVTESIPKTLMAILTDWDQYVKINRFLEGVLLFSDTKTEASDRAAKHFRQFYTTEELQGILVHAVYVGDFNTVRMLAKRFGNNSKELCKFFDYKDGPVNHAAEYRTVDFMERLLKLLRDLLDVDCFKNLFFKKGTRDRNPIFLSAKRIDNFDFLLNHPVVPLTNKEKAHFLVELDEQGKSILRDLIEYRKAESFSNALKTMGQKLDREQAMKLLDNNETFLDRLSSIDLDLVSPSAFDVLLRWSEVYALNNELRKMFVSENFQYLRFTLLRNANIYVVEAFWTFFDSIYRSTAERKMFLDQNAEIFQNAMQNNDRDVFRFVREKYDLLFGPQKSKTMIWELMSNSIYRYYRIKSIGFYWPFFEEIYRNKEERRAKLKEKDHSHRTLLYRAREVSCDKLVFIRDKYNELLNQDDMKRAEINESDLPWYKKIGIFLRNFQLKYF